MKAHRLLTGAAVGLAVLAASACSTAKTINVGPGIQKYPSIDKLIQHADLTPCPKTASDVPATSDAMPNIQLACVGNGPAVDLADLRGQPTVVNLYEVACYPCQKEAGILSTVSAADAKTVRFLGVDIDDTRKDALSYAAATNPAAHYALVSDTDDQVIHSYSPGPPVTVFINSAGSVVHISRGAFTSTAQLQGEIRQYLDVG